MIQGLAKESQFFKDEGTKAFQNGQYELAIEKYTKGIEILEKAQDTSCDEKRAVLEFNISTCYFKLGKLESSLSSAENALKYNPNYVKALYRKAVLLKDLKNYEESVRFIRTILVLDPSNKEAKEMSETLRSQLLKEDQENKDPLKLLKKELENNHQKEISLKVYQQFLLENIETPQDALKAQKKYKLGESFLEHVLSESDMTKINYLLIYTNYFYKMLYKPLFDLNINNQPSGEQLQLIDFLFGDSTSTLNNLLVQVFQKFTSLKTEEEIQNNFFKIFRFLQIAGLDGQETAVQEVVSLMISLHQRYQKDLIIETIKTCLRLNLVSLVKKKTAISEKPLISLLEYLQKISTDADNSAINECIIVGIDFYLQVGGIKTFDDFKENFVYQKSFLTNSLIIVYALLFINYDIGSKHFQSLLGEKKWEADFVEYLSNPKSNVNSRKLVFEILGLYIKEIDGCKEILTKKNFMGALIEGLTMGNSPLFQLKIIVILVKLVLRQPSEEVVKQFEMILNPAYVKSLLDYLITNKEPRAILEFMELILGLSYVEDFKVKLSKIPVLFKSLDKFMSTQFQEKSQQNSLNLAMLLFLVNMVTDAKGENTEKQKQKFQIQDEDLKKLEEVIQRSNQTQAVIPTYTVGYFMKAGIPTTILDSINIENFCRSFINNAEFIKSSKLLREYLPKFLYKLGSYNQKEKAKFVRKDIIRLCLLIWDNSTETPIKEEISKFFSEIFVTCNPAIFDFAEAIQITDILAFAVFHNSHELTLFEATSSLVQFSGLNEDICDRILTKHKMWGTLVLNLCEENDYIVHATLELMNNLSLSETLQKSYADFKTTDRECKVLKALMTKYYETYFDPLMKIKKIDQDMLEEIRLFSNYNSLFQKISLLIGIPVFLNFSKEFIASIDQVIFEVICNVLIKIEEQCPTTTTRIKKEIMDFLYKLFMLFSSQEPGKWANLKKRMLVVAQKILTPYTKEFSQTENEKFKDLISKLSL